MSADADLNDFVLSDIHIHSSTSETGPVTRLGKLGITRLKFRTACCSRNAESNYMKAFGKKSEVFDKDGDLNLYRDQNILDFEVVNIVHQLGSSLQDVGKQIWKGALLMSDYIIAHERRFENVNCLELGAGLGLCSIVAGMFSHIVFCTDKDDEVLSLCQENIENNSYLLRHGVDSVKVRKWDWLNQQGPAMSSNKFDWSQEEIVTLSNVGLILASDVVYDDAITDAFFESISLFLTKFKGENTVTILISLEKRFNFTLSDLDIVCHAYDHFISKLKDFKSLATHMNTVDEISIQCLSVDFEQHFEYNRTKDLNIAQGAGTFLLDEEVHYLDARQELVTQRPPWKMSK